MRSNRRIYLLAALAGTVVVLIALILVAIFVGGHARRPHLLGSSGSRSGSAPGSAPAASVSTFGPPAGSAAALPIPVEDARAVVVRYLDDINTQNRSDAASLICTRLVGDWRKKIDQSGGDFTLAVVRAVLHGVAAAPSGDALTYDLDVRPRTSDQVNTNTVTFTVVGSPGSYQLCGEN